MTCPWQEEENKNKGCWLFVGTIRRTEEGRGLREKKEKIRRKMEET
jgi:hypothetical protein